MTVQSVNAGQALVAIWAHELLLRQAGIEFLCRGHFHRSGDRGHLHGSDERSAHYVRYLSRMTGKNAGWHFEVSLKSIYVEIGRK